MDSDLEEKSGSEGAEQDGENLEEDWYHESDTSDGFPDPNNGSVSLYQDANKLPEPLRPVHFEEGMIYTILMKSKSNNPMLIMVIEQGRLTFVFRCYFVRGSSMKTFHTGRKDQTCKYNDVLRLAPRRELMQKTDASKMRPGETIRFTYGFNEYYTTILITRRTNRNIMGSVECGKDRGKDQTFELVEMVNCTEIFGSSLLQDLHNQSLESVWVDASKTVTKDFPPYKPNLCDEFKVPNDENYKRK